MSACLILVITTLFIYIAMVAGHVLFSILHLMIILVSKGELLLIHKMSPEISKQFSNVHFQYLLDLPREPLETCTSRDMIWVALNSIKLQIYVHISIRLIMRILHTYYITVQKSFCLPTFGNDLRVLIMKSNKRLYLIVAALQYPES